MMNATYVRTQFLELDRAVAALVFNRQDITVSGLCWLVRTYPAVKVTERVPLHGWQLTLLRWIGNGLEHFWPGHCAGARDNDIVRANTTIANLQ
jgi:hypothetical protein